MSAKGPCVKGLVLLRADVKGRGGEVWGLQVIEGIPLREVVGSSSFPSWSWSQSFISAVICCLTTGPHTAMLADRDFWTQSHPLLSYQLIYLRCFSQGQEVTTGGLPFQWWWEFLNLNITQFMIFFFWVSVFQVCILLLWSFIYLFKKCMLGIEFGALHC